MAVEPSAEMLKLAQAKYTDVTWQQDSLPQLKDVEGQYDLVCCINVLMFIDPAERPIALQRMLDLVKPGGLLWLIVRDEPSFDDGRTRWKVDYDELKLPYSGAILVQSAVLPDSAGRDDITFPTFLYRKNG